MGTGGSGGGGGAEQKRVSYFTHVQPVPHGFKSLRPALPQVFFSSSTMHDIIAPAAAAAQRKNKVGLAAARAASSAPLDTPQLGTPGWALARRLY